MKEVFSILSQLGWGLTVGALGAAIGALAQIGVVICAVAGGCGFWWWRRKPRQRGSDPGNS